MMYAGVKVNVLGTELRGVPLTQGKRGCMGVPSRGGGACMHPTVEVSQRGKKSPGLQDSTQTIFAHTYVHRRVHVPACTDTHAFTHVYYMHTAFVNAMVLTVLEQHSIPKNSSPPPCQGRVGRHAAEFSIMHYVISYMPQTIPTGIVLLI